KAVGADTVFRVGIGRPYRSFLIAPVTVDAIIGALTTCVTTGRVPYSRFERIRERGPSFLLSPPRLPVNALGSRGYTLLILTALLAGCLPRIFRFLPLLDTTAIPLRQAPSTTSH